MRLLVTNTQTPQACAIVCEPWRVAIGMALGVWVVLCGALDYALGIHMHGGLLDALLVRWRP